jgi:GNAT superfamily N-acetyltransferase
VNSYTPSRRYGFVRSRKLEGTFPGDPGMGVWPITSLRVLHGWGSPPEEDWPQSVAGWPPVEPPGVDSAAKQHRIGPYKRVRTINDCIQSLVSVPSMGVSVGITEKWSDPQDGRIPAPSVDDIQLGTHQISLDAYDNTNNEFKFWNSWGESWGDRGYGYVSAEVLEKIWWEGWKFWPTLKAAPAVVRSQPQQRTWILKDFDNSNLHCHELIEEDSDEAVAWVYAVEYDTRVEIEELFVRPQFRRRGFGTRLLRLMRQYATHYKREFRLWISYADVAPDNLSVVETMVKRLGLVVEESGVRWAPLVARQSEDVTKRNTEKVLDYVQRPASVGPALLKLISDSIIVAASSGATTLVYQAIRGWIDTRNGRRIKLKIGELELETTQLSQEEFLRLLSVVREIRDSDQVRAKLLEAGIKTEMLDPNR